MQGSSFVLSTCKLTDSLEKAPGKERSWVTLCLATNSPEELTPTCLATPSGASERWGTSLASCSHKISAQPFSTLACKAAERNLNSCQETCGFLGAARQLSHAVLPRLVNPLEGNQLPAVILFLMLASGDADLEDN